MILYDQDFNFIGMSAETLAFLGYEDIDEFTSMNSDFADLFVKKEGFIHKFENFSWIHYILYSGAANKRAYVRQKNGSEAPVDITIKEVFLNHTYDGLRKVYSVKLINENFTKYAKSDVHDSRSKESKEFSLKKLAGEAAVTSGAEQPSETATAEAAVTEPLDFKLDMPETPTRPAPLPEHTPQQPASPEKSEDFILNIPPLDATPDLSETEEKEPPHINFDHHPASEDSDDIFKLDIAATPEPAHAVPVEEEPAKQHPTGTGALPDATAAHQQAQAAGEEDTLVPHVTFGASGSEKSDTASDSEAEGHASLFSFDLLKKEEDALPQQELPESSEKSASAESVESEASADESKPFSFDLFKRETTASKASLHEANEPMPLSDDNKDALINQIKHDIAEIDSESQPDAAEQSEAALKLEQILAESLQEESGSAHSDPQNTTEKQDHANEQATPHFEMEGLTPEDNAPQEERPLFSTPQKSDPQEASFEKTLREVFQIPVSDAAAAAHSAEENIDEKSNHLNLLKPEDENKRSVTKESLKSQHPDEREEEEDALHLPQLGNLGLEQDEARDFIEEFLDDTEASLSLAEEYLNLEDYDNIKYSLIKISSSAEILHFEKILEHARKMSQQCESKAGDALRHELHILKKTVARYKEHYATAVA